MRAVAIVINHNGGEDLGRCLAALAAQELPVRVLLVDNASNDASRRWVEKPPRGVEVLALAKNWGYTGAANAGLAACAGEAEVVGFFNPDCFPQPDFFRLCVTVLEQQPEVGGVAPRLVRPEGVRLDSAGQVLSPWVLMVRDRGYGEKAEGAYMQPGKVLAACGAGMVFRWHALEAVRVEGQVFPQEYFAFWEDVDLGWRLANAGWAVWYEPRAVAIHRRAGSASPGGGRLLFRRPAPVAAGVLLNRWATLLRNLHPADFCWRLPLLLVWDAGMVGALLLRKPQSWRYLRRAPRRLAQALRQRRHLQQRRLRELLP